MNFLYLLQLNDADAGIHFALVVDAPSPGRAVQLAGDQLVANGNLPDEGDWFEVGVSLCLKRSGVYAKQEAGTYMVWNRDGRAVVTFGTRNRRKNRP